MSLKVGLYCGFFDSKWLSTWTISEEYRFDTWEISLDYSYLLKLLDIGVNEAAYSKDNPSKYTSDWLKSIWL